MSAIWAAPARLRGRIARHSGRQSSNAQRSPSRHHFSSGLGRFGAGKAAQVARILGKAMADFRRITNDFRVQIEDEMREMERQTREREIASAHRPPRAAQPAPNRRSSAPMPPTQATGRSRNRRARPPRSPPMASPIPPELAQRRGQEEGGKMSFFEHLAELRTRIIHSAAAILLGAFVGFAVAKPVLAFIARPMIKALRDAHLDDKLIFTHPAGYLNLVIQTGLYLGVVMASPYVLYQIWLFVAPGLYKHERRRWPVLSLPRRLFFGGIVFAYYVILPYLMRFLVSFQGQGPFTPLISIEEYFDLVLIVLRRRRRGFRIARVDFRTLAVRPRDAAVSCGRISVTPF